MVPMEIVADKAGIVELNNLEIKYSSKTDYDEDNIPDTIDTDDDNDGLPDDWEDENELNPMDPDDAGLDSDSDNLTNLEEYSINTDPIAADTDDDGLTDGAEVLGHGTDPNAADTDGDGYSDGQEIEKDTDPLDENDKPGPDDESEEEEGSDVCLAPFYTYGFVGYAIVMMIFMLIIAILAANRKKKAD
jgi:hypothetical protein